MTLSFRTYLLIALGLAAAITTAAEGIHRHLAPKSDLSTVLNDALGPPLWEQKR